MNKILIRTEPTNSETYTIKLYSDNNSKFIFAGFSNEEQMERFFELFGISPDMQLKDIYRKGTPEETKEYIIDWHFQTDILHFWKLEDLPKDIYKIKALSNGSIVDCYYTKKDNIITLYRPNPNAKDIYKPLELEEHLAYKKLYGTF